MSTKHTAREWVLKTDRDFQYSDGVPAEITVASGPEIEDHKKITVIEKTPLIAAAPELLDALKWARSYCREVQCEFPDAIDKKINAAIAKAERGGE